MRHRRGTIGSAKLYQWHKGNRETVSRPTRVASQSGGLRNLHLGIGTGCRCLNGGNDKVHISTKVGPLLLEQHDDSNLPRCCQSLQERQSQPLRRHSWESALTGGSARLRSVSKADNALPIRLSVWEVLAASSFGGRFSVRRALVWRMPERPCIVAQTKSASSSTIWGSTVRLSACRIWTRQSRKSENACCALFIISGWCAGSGRGVPNMSR